MSTPPGPPPGYGQPIPPPAGYGTPPPTPPGAYPPYGAPPAGPPPPRGGGGKIGLIVGAVVVLIGGFALFQLLGDGDSRQGTVVVDDGPTPTPTPAATPDDGVTEPPFVPDPPPDDPPLNVESLVQDPVGQWSLVAVAEVPDFINIGASSALRLQYKNPAGLNIRHLLVAFSSADGAQGGARALVDDIIAQQGQVVEEFPLDVDGEVVGTAYLMEWQGPLIIYSNGQLMTSTAASDLDSIGEFLRNVPY